MGLLGFTVLARQMTLWKQIRPPLDGYQIHLKIAFVHPSLERRRRSKILKSRGADQSGDNFSCLFSEKIGKPPAIILGIEWDKPKEIKDVLHRVGFFAVVILLDKLLSHYFNMHIKLEASCLPTVQFLQKLRLLDNNAWQLAG